MLAIFTEATVLVSVVASTEYVWRDSLRVLRLCFLNQRTLAPHAKSADYRILAQKLGRRNDMIFRCRHSGFIPMIV